MKKLTRKEVFDIVSYLSNIKTEDLTVNEIISELNFPEVEDKINYQSIKYILEEFEIPFKRKEYPKENPLAQRVTELENKLDKIEEQLNRIEASMR